MSFKNIQNPILKLQCRRTINFRNLIIKYAFLYEFCLSNCPRRWFIPELVGNVPKEFAFESGF